MRTRPTRNRKTLTHPTSSPANYAAPILGSTPLSHQNQPHGRGKTNLANYASSIPPNQHQQTSVENPTPSISPPSSAIHAALPQGASTNLRQILHLVGVKENLRVALYLSFFANNLPKNPIAQLRANSSSSLADPISSLLILSVFDRGKTPLFPRCDSLRKPLKVPSCRRYCTDILLKCVAFCFMEKAMAGGKSPYHCSPSICCPLSSWGHVLFKLTSKGNGKPVPGGHRSIWSLSYKGSSAFRQRKRIGMRWRWLHGGRIESGSKISTAPFVWKGSLLRRLLAKFTVSSSLLLGAYANNREGEGSGRSNSTSAMAKHGRHSMFYRMITPDIIKNGTFELPTNVLNEREKGSCVCAFLKVPMGSVSRMGLKRYKGRCWLGKGWRDFVEKYSIKSGYYLVLKYEGGHRGLRFHVQIFDSSTMEIKYPINSARTSNKRARELKVIEAKEKDSHGDDDGDDEVLYGCPPKVQKGKEMGSVTRSSTRLAAAASAMRRVLERAKSSVEDPQKGPVSSALGGRKNAMIVLDDEDGEEEDLEEDEVKEEELACATPLEGPIEPTSSINSAGIHREKEVSQEGGIDVPLDGGRFPSFPIDSDARNSIGTPSCPEESAALRGLRELTLVVQRSEHLEHQLNESKKENAVLQRERAELECQVGELKRREIQLVDELAKRERECLSMERDKITAEEELIKTQSKLTNTAQKAFELLEFASPLRKMKCSWPESSAGLP